MARRIRPARVQARYVEWGDILLSSPESSGGRVRVLGTVIGQLGATEGDGARQWRVKVRDDLRIESAEVPADGYVWVHLPSGQV